MGRVAKATRKFEARHLKRTLDDRKDKAKLKQQFLTREKKKKKRTAEAEDGSDNEGAAPSTVPKSKRDGDGDPKLFEDMSVEQFFGGGFEIPEPAVAGKKTKKPKTPIAEKETPKEEAEGADDDEEEDDEFAKHKEQLAQLAEQDPEFFKYMQQNDPELLDFSMAERDPLLEIDDLSDEEDDEDDAPKKKKKKGKKEVETEDSTEVTMKDVKKWQKAMIEEKSLRCLRQVVLAFRSAAHANDVEEDKSMGGFKYSITNPNGMLPQLLLHVF